MTLDEILTELGGRDRAGEFCGIQNDAIKKWFKAGRIPPKHWQAIVAETGGAVSFETLAALDEAA